MKKALNTFLTIPLVGFLGMFLFASCEKDDGSGPGNGGGSNSFSYVDIGPNLGSDWHLDGAKRSDTGLWALYLNANTDIHKLARYDFQTKQWLFWDFDGFIYDFDVWLEGEDNLGNGAVVVESDETVRSLASTIEWDTEDIDQMKGHVAVGWGPGSAAFTNWIGGHSSGHAVYQETGTCCPLQWNKIDILPGGIQDMWASSREDGYVLATTVDQSFIVYSDNGGEITFAGEKNVIQNVAWDTQTGIPYVLMDDGILYRIEADPNAHSATAVTVADLTEFNYGITSGHYGLDIRSGNAFISFGAVVDLSNGNIRSSWIGKAALTDIEANAIISSIASASHVFTPPNDQDGVYAYLRTTDPNTFEYYETWIRVDNAL